MAVVYTRRAIEAALGRSAARGEATKVRVERVTPGGACPARLVGAVLARDLTVGGRAGPRVGGSRPTTSWRSRRRSPGPAVTIIVAEPGELHEDDAAVRLAKAVAGPNLDVRGPNQSRLDLVAATAGVVNVQVAELERLNRLDPLEVFTVFDGQIVEKGDLVASVKVAPHVVDAAIVEAGARIAGFGSQPIVWVAPFTARRVGVVVKESVRATARERFEASVRAKVEGLGSQVVDIDYVEDDAGRGRDGARPTSSAATDMADLILTAGVASTDPHDAFFVAIAALGGRLVRRGVPAHPGSMLWLARVGRTTILGLPTCGAYSKATAADLLLPRLLSAASLRPRRRWRSWATAGSSPVRQRFRFPPYAGSSTPRTVAGTPARCR